MREGQTSCQAFRDVATVDKVGKQALLLQFEFLSDLHTSCQEINAWRANELGGSGCIMLSFVARSLPYDAPDPQPLQRNDNHSIRYGKINNSSMCFKHPEHVESITSAAP